MQLAHTRSETHACRAWAAAGRLFTVAVNAARAASTDALYDTASGRTLVTQTTVAAHCSGSRRHMLVGDVHLVLVNRAGRVLFGQRQNTGYEDGAWHLPSGHLEAGESVVAALIREAKEEAGIVIDEQ